VVAHLGSRHTQLTAKLAMLGLAIGYALFAYLELTSSHLGERSDLLLLVGNVLCPTALLSYFLFDLNAHSVEGFFAWPINALMNSGLYALLGKLVDKFLRRSEQPAAT
jgi:hypothetical protein